MGRKVGKLIYGVGVNDIEGSHKWKSRSVWREMLRRCYDPKFHVDYPTYLDCAVCEEWQIFSNFKLWFDSNYIDGYQLDKDLFNPESKIYSPDTCFFVPSALNNLFVNCAKSGEYPKGVSPSPSKRGRFRAQLSVNGKTVTVGTYDTVLEASANYKQAKHQYIRQEIQRYRLEGIVSPILLDAIESNLGAT
ncbi:putative AP2 domain-containing protein [Vibrio phage 207E48.1]|nr:putative AP2 domain-containing protein [Vibrio phage 207E48.1]